MNKELIEMSRRHSHIGMFSNSDFTYSYQYKTAFEILYESKAAVDTIALPMLYNLRHCLELALKYNIKYFSDYSQSSRLLSKLNKTHDLEPLVNAYEEHWNRTKKNYKIKSNDKALFDNLKTLIRNMKKLDKTCTSFRYSHHKDESKQFKREQKIDIYRIKKRFEEVLPILYNAIDVFDDRTGLMHGNVTKSDLLRQKGYSKLELIKPKKPNICTKLCGFIRKLC